MYSFNLAPTVTAKPLPTFSSSSKEQHKRTKVKKREAPHIEGYGADDTPRAFARMIQRQTNKRAYSDLDDGEARPKKKSKSANNDATAAKGDAPQYEMPKLLPGERLADFSARVNQAIPVAGLARRGKVQVEGVKERRTLKEKKMHKMYAEWREEDAKIKAQQEELAEKAEEEEEERMAQYGGQDINLPGISKKQRAIGEVGNMDDDPWAVLKQSRDRPKGLHDVVQAPPDLKVIPKEKFKIRNGAKVNVANIPLSAGSLKKREELSDARMEVIARYRALMKANKS